LDTPVSRVILYFSSADDGEGKHAKIKSPKITLLIIFI